MRKSLRLSLLALAGTAALAFAATASATYNPTLKAFENTDNATTDISFIQTNADDPTAQVIILSPAGFTASISQPAGTQLGTLDGSVVAGAFGGATVPVTGTIVAGNPAQFSTPAMQCTGSSTHAAVWLLNVSAAGQSLPTPVPIYVDPGSATPFSAFASSSMTLCLPDPAHATFNIKLLSATLHVTNVFGPPVAGSEFRWTALNIPYLGDTTHINPAGAIQTQVTDHQPIQAALGGSLVTKTTVTGKGRHKKKHHTYFASLTATADTGGVPQEGVAVDFMVGKTKIASGTTNTSGKVKKLFPLKKTTTYTAHFNLDSSDPISGATCMPRVPLAPSVDFPCGSITNAGFSATSSPKRVVRPKH